MANEYLKRTPTSTGNRSVYTWSGWVKINEINLDKYLFSSGDDSSNIFYIQFRRDANNNNLTILFRDGDTTSHSLVFNDNSYRDPSSWIHLVVAVDTTITTPTQDRVKVYINGKRLINPTTDQLGNLSANSQTSTNALELHTIGDYSVTSGTYAKTQIFDYYLIDGQALTPDVFGFYKEGKGYQSSGTTKATDFRPGQWSPHSPRKIKTEIERKGGFGVNGFYLPMNDSSNFGADFHTTPNSIITLKGEDLPQPRNGAPTTSDAFVSQLRQETGSLGFDGVVKFDGSGDCLTVSDNVDFEFGSGNFTIEAFIYYTGSPGTGGDTYVIASKWDNQSAPNDLGFILRISDDGSGDNLQWYYTTDGSTNQVTTGSAILSPHRWYHIAFVRNGTTGTFYINGIADTTTVSFGSNSIRDTGNAFRIGANLESGSIDQEFKGFISNLRVVKGTAVYTSNFTAPTEPLTNVTNTKLLCCNSSTSATASTVTPGSITANGDAFATRNELSGSTVLAIPGIAGGQGSGYGDYSADIKGSGTNKTIIPGNVSIGITGSYYGSALTGFSTDPATFIQNHEDFRFGSDDFTVEAWIYVSDDTAGTSSVLSLYNTSDNRRSWSILKDSASVNGGIRFITSNDGTYNASYNLDPDVSLPTNQWNHIAVEKEGNTGRVYQNGVCVGVNTNFPTSLYSNVNDNLLVGAGIATYIGSNGEQFTNGYIQDLRVYKGVAKYKGGFDVPKSYTPVGIENWRQVSDTCKNNFATLNPLGSGAGTFADGNLTYNSSSDTGKCKYWNFYWKFLL